MFQLGERNIDPGFNHITTKQWVDTFSIMPHSRTKQVK